MNFRTHKLNVFTLLKSCCRSCFLRLQLTVMTALKIWKYETKERKITHVSAPWDITILAPLKILYTTMPPRNIGELLKDISAIPVAAQSKAWFWCRSVRIALGARMPVSCECCVLSGRGLWNGLITRLEESYRVWCVCMGSWNHNDEKA